MKSTPSFAKVSALGLSLVMLAGSLIVTPSALAQFSTRQNNFKELFNNHRVGQAARRPWAGDFWSYAEHGTAKKVLEGYASRSATATSPMQAYDAILGLTGERSAEAWEKENHTCDQYKGNDKETYESCKGWWGHCNGWAAAALKEVEPRAPVQVGNRSLSVADLKGIYSELWLASNSVNEGNTDKAIKTGPWILADPESDEQSGAFWDVTPRALFLLLTNTVGIEQTGVVIDRFTGDEVWNQPLAGYRFLPIRKTDISEDGLRVLLRFKIYWGNDLGVNPGHVTADFDVARDTKDVETVEHLPRSDRSVEDFEGRYLEMYLDFTSPVEIDATGQIVKAGRFNGNGEWVHHAQLVERAEKASGKSYDVIKKMSHAALEKEFKNLVDWGDYNEGHPDFAWLPTSALQDSSGYGNPFMFPNRMKPFRNEITITPASGNLVPESGKIELVVSLDSFSFRGEPSAASVITALRRVFGRDGVKISARQADVQFNAGATRATVVFSFVEGQNADFARNFLTEAGYTVHSSRPARAN